MVQCSGVDCPDLNWFHLECIDLNDEDVIGDDFCCTQECRERKITSIAAMLILVNQNQWLGATTKTVKRENGSFGSVKESKEYHVLLLWHT